MKNLRNLSLILLSLTFTLSSCSKDDEPTPGSETKEVQYKIIGSTGVNISTIVYYDGDTPVSKTGNFGSEWTSEAKISTKTPMISANGMGPNDNSTLKAQIIVDGKVVKESAASTGKILQTNVSLF
ncbi:MmpS family transport accessory protein [Sphingobacterium endophyticum]|uniref:MmpS family transport accessory protein n=1 Tax=Sphingobacterium endophyticum TaxID=2546448 RepID=UPI0012E0DD59|nr:MmpS family transport accessory protein [Sphingobacterium endophyticum]